MPLNVQYGCGLSAPKSWVNFDASPTLRLQKLPIFGKLITKVNFPKNVLYGDIINHLPNIKPASCDAMYCSHVLEHLSLHDCRLALKNTYNLLKINGIFRCVLPDLETSINNYISDRANGNALAALNFLDHTLLGVYERPKTFKAKLISLYANSHHLWMWDKNALEIELKAAGFSNVRLCMYNDSTNKAFADVEDAGRFSDAIAFEAIK